MTQAGIILAVLLTVAATFFATQLRRDEGFAVIGAAAGVSLATLAFLGVEVSLDLDRVAPILMVVGYAALATLLYAEGLTQRFAERLGSSPVWVLIAACVASVLLSNDVVIVAFSAVVLARPRPAIDAAALYVGANVTGGLLPQGSPTNVLLLGDRSFVEYLGVSAPPTAAMVLVAAAAFWGAGRLLPGPAPERTVRAAWSSREKALVGIAVAAVAAQPVCDLLHISRGVLGWALLLVAAALARALGHGVGRVMAQAPWQIMAVVVVLTTGAAGLSGVGDPIAGEWAWATTTFLVSGLGTDILAAALAAPEVLAGAHSPAATLVAVTAGAFVTPVASISGILLLSEHRSAGTTPKPATFAIAGAVAVACLFVGVGTALLVG